MSLEGILRYVNYALLIGIPVFILWGFCRVQHIKKREEEVTLKYEAVLWVFIFYMVCLYMITVFRSGLSIEKIITRPNGWSTINIVPLEELKKLWGYGYFWSFTYNIVGNIVWFLPLGFLLPLIKRKWRLLHVVITGFFVSVSIEVLQFICVTGISDVDDIIFNTLGTVGGYLMYKMVYQSYKRYVVR